jgi:hypothetical protein
MFFITKASPISLGVSLKNFQKTPLQNEFFLIVPDFYFIQQQLGEITARHTSSFSSAGWCLIQTVCNVSAVDFP